MVGRIELNETELRYQEIAKIIKWCNSPFIGEIGKSLGKVDAHLLYTKCTKVYLVGTHTINAVNPFISAISLGPPATLWSREDQSPSYFGEELAVALSARWLAKSPIARVAELDLWFQKAVSLTSGQKGSEAQMFSGRNETHAGMPKT